MTFKQHQGKILNNIHNLENCVKSFMEKAEEAKELERNELVKHVYDNWEAFNWRIKDVIDAFRDAQKELFKDCPDVNQSLVNHGKERQ